MVKLGEAEQTAVAFPLSQSHNNPPSEEEIENNHTIKSASRKLLANIQTTILQATEESIRK